MKRIVRTFLVLVCIGALSSGLVLAEPVMRGFGFGGAMAMAYFPDMTGINTFMSENGLPPMCDVLLGAGGNGRGGVIGGLAFGGIGWGVVAESSNEELSAELVFGGGGFDIGAAIGGDERSVLTIGTVLGAGANVLTLNGYLVQTITPEGLVPEPTVREIGRVTGFVQPYLSMSAQLLPWMGFEFRAGYIVPVIGFDFGDLLGIPAPSLELSGPTVSFGLSFGGIGSGRDVVEEGEWRGFEREETVKVVSDGSFEVAPGSELVIENGFGDVLITSYDVDTTQTAATALVEWEATRTATVSEIDQLVIGIESEGPTASLRTIGDGQVDYVLRIPSGIDLKVKNGAGSLTVLGHEGQTIILESGLGEIVAKDLTAVALLVAGGVGSIDLHNLDAQALIAEMGVGEIDVALPADVSAKVSAKASIGDVSIDRFPGMIGGTRGFIGHTGDVTIGSGDRTVELKVSLGEISVRVSD